MMYPARILLTRFSTPIVLMTCLTTLAQAQESQPQPAFHQQYQAIGLLHAAPTRTGIMDHFGYRAPDSHTLPLSRRQRDDLAFNYLWLQRYDGDYRDSQGGAALGRLLRMGVRSLYRSYNHRGVVLVTRGDDEFTTHYAEIEYKVRLREDQVKLGIEYNY